MKSPRNLAISEVKTPIDPKMDEAIIKIKYAAICGTDIHLYKGETPAKYPVILGHEYSGEILMVGSGIRKFKPGDRIVGSYMASCGRCEFCMIGKTNLCERRLMFGINIDGSFAEYMRIPLAERVLVKVPDEIDLEDAVLIPDTFLTALNAVEKGLKAGDSILITGLGNIGLSTVIAAKMWKASKIIGMARREKPKNIAMELGLKYIINPEDEDALNKIMKLTDNYGVDVAIETSGYPKNIKLAFESLKPGGKLIQVAIPTEPVTLDLKYMIGMEKEIIGALNPGAPIHIKRALNIIGENIKDLRKIVTHKYPLEEIDKAIETIEKKIGDPVKIIIKVE